MARGNVTCSDSDTGVAWSRTETSGGDPVSVNWKVFIWSIAAYQVVLTWGIYRTEADLADEAGHYALAQYDVGGILFVTLFCLFLFNGLTFLVSTRLRGGEDD